MAFSTGMKTTLGIGAGIVALAIIGVIGLWAWSYAPDAARTEAARLRAEITALRGAPADPQAAEIARLRQELADIRAGRTPAPAAKAQPKAEAKGKAPAAKAEPKTAGLKNLGRGICPAGFHQVDPPPAGKKAWCMPD